MDRGLAAEKVANEDIAPTSKLVVMSVLTDST